MCSSSRVMICIGLASARRRGVRTPSHGLTRSGDARQS